MVGVRAAGSISQTLTYPVDVVRRKMQVSGMADGAYGPKYTGGFDVIRGILRTEGVGELVPLVCTCLVR